MGKENVEKIIYQKNYVKCKYSVINLILIKLRNFIKITYLLIYFRISKEKCEIVRISEPIKSSYAKTHNLDLSQLMADTPYKEQYRLDMIKWSEEVRHKDYGYFCKAACENGNFYKTNINMYYILKVHFSFTKISLDCK